MPQIDGSRIGLTLDDPPVGGVDATLSRSDGPVRLLSGSPPAQLSRRIEFPTADPRHTPHAI